MIRQGRLSNATIDGQNGYLRFNQKGTNFTSWMSILCIVVESAALEDANCRLAAIFQSLESIFNPTQTGMTNICHLTLDGH